MNHIKIKIMKTIGVRIPANAEKDKAFFRDILISNIIDNLIDLETKETNSLEKQQGYGSRKKEVIIKLILD
jgi:hypothetical protein